MAKRPNPDAVLRSLMVPRPAANSDPTLDKRPEVVIPVARELDIDQLRPYDRNPRHTENSKREELKESIRALGLLSPLTVTRRPTDPEDSFMIQAGGNTRLGILRELWDETRDPRFKMVMCLITPWTSEPDVYARHLAENEGEMRCELLAIDKAHAMAELKLLIEQEEGQQLAQDKFTKRLNDFGLATVSARQQTRLAYVLKLDEALPNYLRRGNGISNNLVDQIIKIDKTYKHVWCSVYNKLDYVFDATWNEVIRKYDDEDNIEINDLEKNIKHRLAEELSISSSQLDYEVAEVRLKLRRPAHQESAAPTAAELQSPVDLLSQRRPSWEKTDNQQSHDDIGGATSVPASAEASIQDRFSRNGNSSRDVNAGDNQERTLVDSSPEPDASAEDSDSDFEHDRDETVDSGLKVISVSSYADRIAAGKQNDGVPDTNTRPFDHFRGQLRMLIDAAYQDAIAALDAGQIRFPELMSRVTELAMSANSQVRPTAAGYTSAILARIACLFVGLTDCVVEDSRSPCGFWMELPSVADGIRSASDFLPMTALRSAADLPTDLEWPSHTGRIEAANQQCNWWWYLYGLCGGSRIPLHLPGMTVGEQASVLTRLGSLQLHQACYEFSPAGELAHWQNFDKPIMRADEQFSHLIDENLERLKGLPPEQFSLVSVDQRFATAVGAPAWTSMPLWIATLPSDEFTIHQTFTVLVRAQQLL